MRTRFIVLCALLALIFLAGWFRANMSGINADYQSKDWAGLKSGLAVEYNTPIVAEVLKTYALFPKSIAALEAEASNDTIIIDAAEDGQPRFPKIVSAVIQDGRALVVLLNPDKTLTSAGQGDVLETGWQLKAVDLDRVIAVFDDEEQVFPVTNYDIQDQASAASGSDPRLKDE